MHCLPSVDYFLTVVVEQVHVVGNQPFHISARIGLPQHPHRHEVRQARIDLDTQLCVQPTKLCRLRFEENIY